MSRYRILKKSFLGGRLLYPGEEIEFTGTPGSNLELIVFDEPVVPVVPPAGDGGTDTDNLGDGSNGSDGSGASGASGASGGDGGTDAELTALKDQYTQLFGKNPHHNAGADKLRADIDAKRKELGV